MKTTDEIKKALECCGFEHWEDCNCDPCPYAPKAREWCNARDDLRTDALALIQQLEAERDAAVEALEDLRCRNLCNSCKRSESGRLFLPGEYGCPDLICKYEPRSAQKEE